MTESKQLKDLADSQVKLNEDLKSVEGRIYELETEYLEDTVFGNFLRGLDTFLDVKARASNIKRTRAMNKERAFSLSSLTSPLGPMLDQIEAEANMNRGDEGAAAGLRSSSRHRKRARHRNALNEEDEEDDDYSDAED